MAENKETELYDVAEERLGEIRQDPSLLVDIIKARPSDPTVRLPEPNLHLLGDYRGFERGNKYNKAAVGEYRQAIREALDANPQLWVKIYSRMTPMQREYMVMLSESASLGDCNKRLAEKHGNTSYNWYNKFRSWTEVVREGIIYGSKALYDEPMAAATAIKKAHLTKAALVKVQGLDSQDERVRQGVATELLEWEYGKAGVRLTTETDDKLGDIYERMVAAMEKSAGLPVIIEGDAAVDVTPDGEPETG